jgi:hypothetical protein
MGLGLSLCDWLAIGGIVIGLLCLWYAVRVERRARLRLDTTRSFLVGLKPSIEGPAKERTLAAIDDQLESLKK